MADQHAPQRAGDRIQAVQRLARQPGQGQRRPQQTLPRGAQDHRQVLVERHVVRFLEQLLQRWQQRRDQQQGEDRQGPAGRLRQAEPARQQHRQQGRRLQAAAQVVENLPARQCAQAIGFEADALRRHPRQQPRQQLPVAANPAMPALAVDAVARGMLLEQLHIRQQARAGVAALDQVVAENAVVGETPGEGLLEGIHRIDALADERALLEQVLIDVGDGAGVGIDPRLAAEQPGIGGACGARQADADPRLQDRVAGADAAFLHIVDGAVERMLHGADQLLRRIARQLGIGVEGDDVTHGLQGREIADDQRKTLQPGAAQQRIEFGELAALALVAHPHLLGRIPAPRAVEQEEVIGIRVFAVQRLDALTGQRQQRRVLLQHLARGIHEVGQQREMQMGVAVGQKAHLQALDQFLDILLPSDEGRHHHQGARLGGDALAEVQARQLARRHAQGHQPVDQAERQPAGGQQHRQREQHQQQPMPAAGLRRSEERRGEQQGEQQGQAEVDAQRCAGQQAQVFFGRGPAHAETALQRG
ncbi:hypothetical protein D3C78_638680 [compost metagenome]